MIHFLFGTLREVKNSDMKDLAGSARCADRAGVRRQAQQKERTPQRGVPTMFCRGRICPERAALDLKRDGSETTAAPT
jgi:hypothetical protein